MIPLPQTHPQLSVHNLGGDVFEFKVESWRVVGKDGRIKRGARWWSVVDLIVLIGLAWIWDERLLQSRYKALALAAVVVRYLHSKCNHVLWESILAFPSHGVQLEVHRGIPPTPLTPPLAISVSRRFVPLHSVMDIVINEGLRTWDFRYYLAVIRTTQAQDSLEDVQVEVGFENINPPFAVLSEVYHGLREVLFDEIEDSSTDR